MIILLNKLLQMELTTYALDTDGVLILNKIVVPSVLNCTARREWVDELVNTKQITPHQGGLMYENMHDGDAKETYIANDPTIPTDQLTAAEMYDYAESVGIQPPFPRDATVQEAIIAVRDTYGYLFNRITQNNI